MRNGSLCVLCEYNIFRKSLLFYGAAADAIAAAAGAVAVAHVLLFINQLCY